MKFSDFDHVERFAFYDRAKKAYAVGATGEKALYANIILKNLEKNELQAFLVVAIDRLTEQEKLVIALYYYEELTLKEIGEVMKISESRVSQIHTKAVLKLRGMVRERFGLS